MEEPIIIGVNGAKKIIRLLGNERILTEYSPGELFELYRLRIDLMALVAKAEKRQIMREARRAIQ